MPSYYFLEKNNQWTNIREATIIPCILSIHGKGFSCKLSENKLFQNLEYDPLSSVKIVFQYFVLLNFSELVFYPFSQTKSNSVKLILSVWGTTFSLYVLSINLQTIGAYTERTDLIFKTFKKINNLVTQSL